MKYASFQSPLVAIIIFAGALMILASSQATAAEPLRIMPVGDSITAGYTDNNTWNVPFGFGYRSGLYTRLTGNYDFQFVGSSQEPWNNRFGLPKYVSSPDLRLIDQDHHRGYGGWGIDDIYNNINSWLVADDPDVILLMIGINNITEGSTGNPTTYETKLNNLVNRIVTNKPDAHLIVAQITPYARQYTQQIVNYNNYIKNTLVPTYVNLHKNVTTVDQYSNFLTSGGAIDTSLYSNGINHPNAVGYDRMAQTWYQGIRAVVVPEPSPFILLAMGLLCTIFFLRR
jgi:hypothetical protein